MSENHNDFNDLTTISSHLEYLGYEIEKQNNLRILAKHSVPTMLPCICSYFYENRKPEIVSFSCRVLFEKPFSLEIAEFINRLNQKSHVSSIYCVKDEQNIIVHVESIFTGVFSKPHFAAFWSMFLADQALLSNEEAMEKLHGIN
jgi:hypothetical protein